jgi:hypothetical protein
MTLPAVGRIGPIRARLIAIDSLKAVIPGRQPISGLPEIGHLECQSRQSRLWVRASPESITTGLGLFRFLGPPGLAPGMTADMIRILKSHH